MKEHYHTELLKRIIINKAMVPYANGEGMAVSARRAVDEIIALLFPDEEYRKLPENV